MSSFNQCTLVGNLGADPEGRATSAGDRVASFSLATSEKWTDRHGQSRERTEWHRCIAWNTGHRKLADLVERYVSKGDKLLVLGKIRYRTYDKNGETHYSTEIDVQQITFLTSKKKPAGETLDDARPE